ncbi:LTA synthase family protein [Nitrosomonas sp.]|uniref:LTA synthase family protein n=1 Tax=Nitrosomonas sp. TaxID=42353 RepID=UPI0026328DA4|nr:LTA synthase family protein [Nitrosomonas sp.]
MVDVAFSLVIAVSLIGLMVSVVIEHFMVPRPLLMRPRTAWALHVGLWLTVYALLVLLLGRPWFSAAVVSAFLLMLVLVNNAKVKALHEPFVFQDYEYFTDAIRYPRLYIPFLGWWKFLGAAAGFILAVSVGLWGEATPEHRFFWFGQLGGVAIVLITGVLLLLAGSKEKFPVTFDPELDIQKLGLLASFWRYGWEERRSIAVTPPFDLNVPQKMPDNLPHLVAVQSESFFDPRSLYSGIHSGVLAEFDRLKADAIVHGKLKVPAWGANTVRTEFAFLSGISEAGLGVHRFNPYRAVSGSRGLPSLASYLKGLGYRTVCIHPYPVSFYQRDRVYPRLGFDEFIDIRAFDDAMRFGPYISDVAVADKVNSILRQATVPTFVFAITMENHGPLHLERVTHSDIDELYFEPPPAGCNDLTVYLRHQRNAGRMIAKLRQMLEQCVRPASLCWFGDHVPIMPIVYQTFGKPEGDVEYVFWHNQEKPESRYSNLVANDLSTQWLREAGVL